MNRTSTLLALDPGGVTGWSTWVFDDEHPIQRLEFGLIRGGVAGARIWFEDHLGTLRPDVLVCERFNPKLGTGGTDKDYEAMWIQGGLYMIAPALGLTVTWHDVGMKAMCRDETLKEFGLWINGPEIDHEDGRDVNDSQLHALGWAKAHNHSPSVEFYWPPM